MIYLFYGKEPFLMEQELKKIQEKEQIDPINVSRYDLESSRLDAILEDAETISFFTEKKLIVVENAYLFTGATTKKLPEQPTELLEQYLSHPSPDTILVFTIAKEKLDERKKIVKKIKEKAIVKECSQTADLKKTVKQLLEPYQISSADLTLFLDRVGDHLAILAQEVEKMKLYKENDLVITSEDILALTTKTIDTDLFHLIENIVNHQLEAAMESYSELMKLGEEPIKIIIMLANQFRLIYQTKVLAKQGYSEKRIAEELEIHPYRVKLALQKGRTFQESFLLQCIKQLAELDSNIKHGKIEKELGLELFLLGT